MGLRQRSGFDGFSQPQDVSREELNLTKYDERYIMPTDGRAFAAQSDNNNGTTDQTPAVPQSPVAQTEPSPVYRDRNYVFGGDRSPAPAFATKNEERNYVFGNSPAQSSAQSDTPHAQNGAYSQVGGVPPVNTGERPMVFVLRDDRNMYVYEYSDRLEYYRRTEYGMSYCATKFKNTTR